MALRASNTMAEGLQALVGTIASMKALPDADMEFLTNLETMVLNKLKEPVRQMAGQMDQVGPGGPPMGPPPGMGGPPMMPPPMGAPGGPPTGVRMGSPMGNPDELRRLLGGGGVQGG